MARTMLTGTEATGTESNGTEAIAVTGVIATAEMLVVEATAGMETGTVTGSGADGRYVMTGGTQAGTGTGTGTARPTNHASLVGIAAASTQALVTVDATVIAAVIAAVMTVDERAARPTNANVMMWSTVAGPNRPTQKPVMSVRPLRNAATLPQRPRLHPCRWRKCSPSASSRRRRTPSPCSSLRSSGRRRR